MVHKPIGRSEEACEEESSEAELNRVGRTERGEIERDEKRSESWDIAGKGVRSGGKSLEG